MRSLYLVPLAIILAAGCIVTRPVKEVEVSTSFQARLESRGTNRVKIRCIFVYPPGERTGDIWNPKALKVKAADKPIQYSVDYSAQDMFHDRCTITKSRFVLSPVAVKKQGRMRACEAQAVISIDSSLIENAKVLIITYDGSGTLKSKGEFDEEVKLR